MGRSLGTIAPGYERAMRADKAALMPLQIAAGLEGAAGGGVVIGG